MNQRATFQLSINFLVLIIICTVIFIYSISFLNNLFWHIGDMQFNINEQIEGEIWEILNDGGRVAIPFDTEIIGNGQYGKFAIGILNVLNTGSNNKFRIITVFSKAYDKGNNLLCDNSNSESCGKPNTWLQMISGFGIEGIGVSIEKSIKNNEQGIILILVEVKNAPSADYFFDLTIEYEDFSNPGVWIQYDSLHKLHVKVP